jgi:DNA-binding beta-propeller fold protein YncE
MRAVLGVALVLAFAAPAHAASFFQSAWGEDVITGNAPVGPEVCTVSQDCKEGVADGVGGAFSAPSTVASDGSGNVYVLEEAGNRVQKYSSAGVFQRMWGKDVIAPGAATDTGTGFEVCTVAADCTLGSQGALGGELSHPRGIAVDADGNVYVADTANNRVQEYTAAGAFIRAFGRSVDTTQPGTFAVCTVPANCGAGDAAPGGAGTVYSPLSIAVDSDGAIYIGSGLRRVDKFTVSGGVPTFDRTWGADVDNTGGTGFEVCTVSAQCQTGTIGTGLGGEFGIPAGIAVAAGNVYVFGSNRFRVDKFTTSGAFLRTWGKDVVQGGGTGFEICTVAADCKTGVTGSAGGEFRSPNDDVGPASDAVAVDPSGTTVYVADRENDRLQVFTTAGDFKGAWGLGVDSASFSTGPQVCTVAANCTAGSQVSPLPGGGMSRPTGVAADGTGAVYEVDQTAARVQRFAGVLPDPPVVTATNHGVDPANDNHPLVIGTAGPGTTVELYDNPGCTGAPIGTGTAAEFASPGIAATVPDDSITQIFARTSTGAGSSDCSATSVGYEEISTLRWHTHFDAAGANVSEEAGSITVTISRSGTPNGTASVHFATADGTAGAGDYGAVSGTLTFAPGQTSKTVDVPILHDQLHEGDETFTIALSGPGLGTDVDAPASETITIVDDDSLDTPDTIITSGPDRVSWTTTPTFTFTSTDPGATFRCRVDNGPEVACKSPYTIPAVKSSGSHSFFVTAVSPAGLADPSPARRDFHIAPTETHKFKCELRGFVVDPKTDGYTGCSVEPAGRPCSGIFAACDPAVPACPVGAKCTYVVKADGADQDPHVLYVTNGYAVTRVTPEIRANHGFSFGKAGMIAWAGCFHAEEKGDVACPKTGAPASAIGDGTAPSFLCPTNNSPDYQGDGPSLGPASARFIRCDFTMTIEAAATLVTTASPTADGFTTFAPGPGTVTATPAGKTAGKASVARVRTQAAFARTSKRVARAGPVRFKLKFSKAAKAQLRDKHRLVLVARLVFTPRKGKTASRTVKVTLLKPRNLKQTGPARSTIDR